MHDSEGRQSHMIYKICRRQEPSYLSQTTPISFRIKQRSYSMNKHRIFLKNKLLNLYLLSQKRRLSKERLNICLNTPLAIKSRLFSKFTTLLSTLQFQQIQKIIQSFMANDKYKVIQNYCLEQLKQIYPNQTQIWNVRHKVLKKMFTLKKTKYRSNLSAHDQKKNPFNNQVMDQYDKLVSQTNLLKRLDVQFAPKCYKMIKTTNNVYLVYQEFPPFTLEQQLLTQPLNAHQRTQLIENLVKSVLCTHDKAHVILGLNLNNIYVKQNLQVFFGDWSLSKSVEIKEKIALETCDLNSEFMANEVRQEGAYGLWSDIYSLGKIFKAIQKSCHFQAMDATRKSFQNLINKMISKNYKQRPSIKQVLSTFGKKITQEGPKIYSQSAKQIDFETTLMPHLQMKKACTLEQQFGQQTKKSKLKSIKSANLLLGPKGLDSPKSINFQLAISPRSGTSKLIPSSEALSKSVKKFTFDDNNLNSLHSHNHQSPTSERNWQGNPQIFKSINKKRHLSFMLIDLGEFVLRSDLNPELGFLLLKYSLLIFKQNYQRWTNQRNSSQQHKIFLEILQKELLGIQQIVMMLIDQLKQLAITNLSFKKEIDLSNIINDRYMKEKIVQFSKQIVLHCEKNQLQQLFPAKITDVLFKTYLILMKVEQGSYQKFWEKSSNQNLVSLSNQKYLKEQKSLGFRYLKSRIAQILSKKRH